MNLIKIYVFLLLNGFFLFSQCRKDDTSADKNNTIDSTEVSDTTFKNPLLQSGPDPWVYQKDSFYYYTHTLGNRIGLIKTKYISQLSKGTFKTIWTPPAGTAYSRNLWAPEIHFINDKWYAYFAADDGNDVNHRLYVLENSSSDPMQGSWEFKGKISDLQDKWAIDGTVFHHNEQMYFIWSGWKGNNSPGVQQIYIAKMTNPWTLEGTRVMISQPVFEWEKNGEVNEGPEILKNKDGDVYLFFSASGCWTDSYSLGIMALKENGNPLSPADWIKSPLPVFTTNETNNAYSPGHNSFFKSPDGTEDWIIYHANSNPKEGCGDKRSPRMQKINWTVEGKPDLGIPVKTNVSIAKPSGEVSDD